MQVQRVGIFTQQEYVVLHYLCCGKTSKEISNALDISPKTVEAHKEHIYAKLNEELGTFGGLNTVILYNWMLTHGYLTLPERCFPSSVSTLRWALQFNGICKFKEAIAEAAAVVVRHRVCEYLQASCPAAVESIKKVHLQQAA